MFDYPISLFVKNNLLKDRNLLKVEINEANYEMTHEESIHTIFSRYSSLRLCFGIEKNC